jgi:hypothetical protein
MVAEPAEFAVAKPDEEPMLTIALLLLFHVPPVTGSPRVVVKPLQMVVVPVIAARVLTETLAN